MMDYVSVGAINGERAYGDRAGPSKKIHRY